MQQDHPHHHSVVTLPLRLAAEPYAKKDISPSCVSLGILSSTAVVAGASNNHPNVELAALVDDDGIQAFCCSHILPKSELLERIQAAVDGDNDIATTGWKTDSFYVLTRDTESLTNPQNNPNQMRWIQYLEDDIEQPIPVRCRMQDRGRRPVHNAFVAQLVTNSIRHYYQQQILEPSVRGFLSVLEKQFARADLYMFELLQNAVDDGASVVEFQLRQDGDSNNSALHMIHNGRPFTPLDVLGLSSVGLSTKSRQGKRTIGFMGVGFKAVYKRYSRVSIDDGTYRFVYQEPTTKTHNMGYGWVMLPLWQQQPKQEDTTSSRTQDRTGWCHFKLEQPRGGPLNIKRDLQVLPRTAPPLLGRAALVKMTGADKKEWILDWNRKRHTIERSSLASFHPSSSRNVVDIHGSELVTVTIENNNKVRKNHWLFVTHKYKPSHSARETYRNHTKRSQEGYEEICGFVPLLSSNNSSSTATTVAASSAQNATDEKILHTLPSKSQATSGWIQTKGSPQQTSSSSSTQPSGWIHSVLPTKIKMPVPIHFQGSWLLSVDRQHVQDLTDNAWNAEIVSKFPNLIATIWRWAADQKLDSAQQYQAICELLPTTTMTKATNDSSSQNSVVDILGQQVSLQALEQAFWSEPILPVGMTTTITTGNSDGSSKDKAVVVDDDFMEVDLTTDNSGSNNNTTRIVSTSYYEGSNTIWVPPSWFEFLDAGFMRGWLGKRPLRTDLLGKTAYHSLFGLNHVLSQLNPLPNRTSQLASELGVRAGRNVKLEQDSIWKTIRLMAAIGSAYDEHPVTEKSGNSNNGKRNSDDTTENSPSLPSSISDWPVFITENGGLTSLDHVVLPGADFGELPTDLQLLLRPHLLKQEEMYALPQQPSKKLAGKKGGRNNNQRLSSRKPPPKKRLHNLLESTIFAIDRYSIDPTGAAPQGFEESNPIAWSKAASSACSFLARSREQLPSQVIGVPAATSNFFESYTAKRQLSDEDVGAVLELSKYAFETNNHLLLSHVLVDSVSPSGIIATKLVKASSAYIGKSLDESGNGAALEDFAGSKLQYVSYRYNSCISTTSLTARKRAIQLFALAGVQTGMSISVSLNSNIEKDRHHLEEILPALPDRKLPALRKNATKADVYIPYGLGQVMNKKKYYLVDSALPTEWERLAKAMSPSSAIGFMSLLLSIPLDDATDITPKTVVAAAKCLTGQTEPNAEKAVPVQTAKLSKDTAAPLKRRLYFLPPGQAGAKAINMSRSQLVHQLESIKWLPCSMPSHQQGSLTLLRPCEALLDVDPTRPEMPLVSIPPLLLKRLKSSLLTKALTWGTQAPPPPIGELAELAKEAEILLSADISVVDKDAVAACAARMYDTWNAVCRSHMRDGLSPADKKTLRMLSTKPSIPVRRVLDSGGGNVNWIVSPTRCVRMSTSIPEAQDEKDELKNLTVASLVSSDFICDFNHSTHNPFFHQPELSNAVIHLAGIRSIADVETNALITVCGAFVRHLCATEPIISIRSSPLRRSFSFCMNWCLERPTELPKRGQGVKLFVRRGPGIGTKTLPARWVPIKDGPVQAVLGDSKLRSALLSPEMKIQLLGVLDHIDNDKDGANAKLLASIDARVIKALGLLRLSDKRFTVKTRAKGTPNIVSEASCKLQLVCALLKSMESENLSSHGSVKSMNANTFLDGTYEPPLVVRHEALTREFQAPGMEAPSSIPLYAMFGRAPKLTKGKCILVCGTPDDYSMELEELIFDHVGVRAALSVTQMKPYRAAARLLSHLEDDVSFNKFVDRDFADFEATSVWKTLVKKKDMLRKLDKAEKSNDRETLRELLVEAEEFFEDEMDGGDSILQSARDLLVKLEEEWAAKVAEEEQKQREETTVNGAGAPKGLGRGRGVDNRPAWMTTDGSDDNLTAKATENGTQVDKSLESEPTVESVAATGRGRGISNLPAWMTSTDGPCTITETLTTTSQANDSKESKGSPSDRHAGDNTLPAEQERGAGRGVSNLPAWMTSGEATTAENPVKSEPVPNGMGRGVDNRPAWMKTSSEQASEEPPTPTDTETLPSSAIQAKSILSSILNATTGEEPDIAGNNVMADAPAAGRGRGRGVSNLPAWMTNKDGLGQGRSEGENLKRSSSSPSNLEDADDEPQAKKQRLDKGEKQQWPTHNFRVTLDIDYLVPSQATDFMTWFEPNVKKQVEARGGTLTNLSSNRNDSSKSTAS